MTEQTTPADYDRRSEELWASIDEYDEEGFRSKIEELVAELPADSAVADFERACAFDSTGHSDQAVSFYRRALELGLAGERRRRAVIQLASSLRNLDHVSESVALLVAEREQQSDQLDDAVSAFLALALVDSGREREATSVALSALAPHLPRYRRSLRNYAQELGSSGSGALGEPAGKYARFELERRFLVGPVPEGIAGTRGWRVEDRYIEKTRLRLRRMEPLRGGETVFKLGQKLVPSPPDFSRTTITNIYLSRVEFEVLAELEARELRKVRHVLEFEGRSFGVDVFEGSLAGLVLAEVGFQSDDELAQPLDLPPWVTADVSNDIRFTGAALADLTADQAADLIREATAQRSEHVC